MTKYKAKQQQLFLSLQWWLISTMLIAGALLPMFTFEKFYFFNDSFSLISSISHLFAEGEYLLFLILLLSSVIAPLYKMVIVRDLIDQKSNSSQRKKDIKRLLLIGKWSMADVFVVAIVAATVKLGMLANVNIRYGLYVFSLGVVGSMLLNHQVIHRDEEALNALIEEKINKSKK